MEHQLLKEQLDRIEQLLAQQTVLSKSVLSLEEACYFLGIKKSHMYKLTSQDRIPHFQPEGKRIYFKRTHLEEWLMRNPKTANYQIDQMATAHLTKTQSKNNVSIR